MNRYFLKADHQAEWTEVDKVAWVRAERAAGFRNTMGKPDEPGTGGFTGHGMKGNIVNMEYYKPGSYSWDPSFERAIEGTVLLKRWPDLCYEEDIEGGQGFTCSLVTDHDGDHLAAEGDSPDGRVLAEWPREAT